MHSLACCPPSAQPAGSLLRPAPLPPATPCDLEPQGSPHSGTLEYLSDISGFDRRWDENYSHGQELATRLYTCPDDPWMRKLGERVGNCCPWLRMSTTPDPDKPRRLEETYFCHVRHCPIDAHRRALAYVRRHETAEPELERVYPEHRWVFLTFTLRNCSIWDLRREISNYLTSFRRLRQRRHLWPAVGCARRVEVTYGKDGDPTTAHPHLHALMLVPPDYFTGPDYLDHAAWVDAWQSCARVDYSPGVYVKAIEPRNRRALLEAFKYLVKPGDLRLAPDAWVWEMVRQVHGLKEIGVCGQAEFRQLYRDEDPDDEELLLAGEGDETEEDDEETQYTTYFPVALAGLPPGRRPAGDNSPGSSWGPQGPPWRFARWIEPQSLHATLNRDHQHERAPPQRAATGRGPPKAA